MTPETNLKTAIYNYWDWFESQYIDRDDLPDGMYEAPDGEIVNDKQILQDFLDDLVEKLNEVINDDIAPRDKEIRFTYDILNHNNK